MNRISKEINENAGYKPPIYKRVEEENRKKESKLIDLRE
jgi:hypothetical protein